MKAKTFHKLHWGLTKQESEMDLPGDELISNVLVQTTRAILIHAPSEAVWPWIVQIGQGRGGFYSYEWLENILGMDIHNANCVLPEYQDLQVGDMIPFWKNTGIQVLQIKPGAYFVLGGSLNGKSGLLGGTWSFFCENRKESSTRLILRARVARFSPVWLSFLFSRLLLEPAQFIMERRMLLGIKSRVEGSLPTTSGCGYQPVRVSSATICCHGSLDWSNYRRLIRVVAEEIFLGANEIIVDLSNVERISLSGMVALYLAGELLECKLTLVNPSTIEQYLDQVDGWEVIHNFYESLNHGVPFHNIHLTTPSPTLYQSIKNVGLQRLLPIV